MAFIHAHLMSLYAEDAMKHDEPWKLWQRNLNGAWVDCVSHPGWSSDNQYRRKPRTDKIAGYEVPEPCKVSLQLGQEYFVPILTSAIPIRRTWLFNQDDKHALASNLVRRDQQSAALHAKALIEVSKGWW
jgi:hypothetical protein